MGALARRSRGTSPDGPGRFGTPWAMLGAIERRTGGAGRGAWDTASRASAGARGGASPPAGASAGPGGVGVGRTVDEPGGPPGPSHRARAVAGRAGDASAVAARRRRPPFQGFLVVAGVALAVRLAVFALAQGDPGRLFYRPDSFEYDALARNLASRGTYSQTADPTAPPELARTPGYPLVVAGVYFLVGHRPQLAVLLNVLLGAGVSCLTYLLGLRLFGGLPGLVAGLILALDVVSVVYANLLLSETAFKIGRAHV